MCKVIAIRHVEDCFDDDFIKEFELDRPLDERLMKRMAVEAKLQYFPNFPKPFFRIDKRGAYTVQGVIGKATFRVTFDRSGAENMEGVLKCQLEKGDHHGC
jgi:hypothetical protein